MTISASLKPLDLRDELEAANMKGKNLTFLDDYSKEELGHLFKAANCWSRTPRTRFRCLPTSSCIHCFSSRARVPGAATRSPCTASGGA